MTQIPMNDTQLSGLLTSLEGRYAKTLYDIALEQNKVKVVATQYAQFVAFLKAHPELEQILMNRALTQQEQGTLFETLSTKLELDKVLVRFFELLADNRRLDKVRDIQSLFQRLHDWNERIQHVDIISAQPLTSPQQATINRVLSQKIHGTVVLSFLIDPELLGGIYVRFGNHVIDLTFLHQLNTLTSTMKGTA